MRLAVVAGACVIAVLVAGCTVEVRGPVEPTDVLGDDAVTVGSFNFGESVLLAELYAQSLEARGIRVVRELDIGPRELVQPALERGLLEIVPEYTGSLLGFLRGGSPGPDLSAVRRDLVAALGPRELTLLASAPAQDQNAFAVTEEAARELELASLSDLAGQSGLVLGGPPECPRRLLCQQGLEEVYGVEFDSFVPLDLPGTRTAEALARGLVDVALMFTTSPEVVRYDLVLLEDDRQLQPSEHVTPVVHRTVLDRFGPELAIALDAVSVLLTTEELRAMNAQVEIGGRPPREVARDWLTDHGLVSIQG